VPLGVLGAIYVNEYGGRGPLARVVRFMSDVMTGVPSIIMGLFIFSIWVVRFGTDGVTGFAGALALGCLMLPIIIRSTEEMLRLVPDQLREASYALGAKKARTIVRVVMPPALPGILSGVLLAVARAAGETAPLILVSSVFDGKEVLFKMSEAMPNVPVRIFQLSEEGNPEGIAQAWGMSLVLITIILLASVGARAMHARSRRKMSS